MRTADLTAGLLDYWVARAEGIDAADLVLRNGQCYRQHHDQARHGGFARAMNYSTNWALCGPLVEKHNIIVGRMITWHAIMDGDGARGDHWIDACDGDGMQGETPPIAICRAVVRAVFGDQVEDLTP